MTTDQIDEFVYNEAINNNAYPSPLRYCGFPKSVCTSVNNIACHGMYLTLLVSSAINL